MTTAEIVDVLEQLADAAFFSLLSAVKFSCAGISLRSWNARGNCCST